MERRLEQGKTYKLRFRVKDEFLFFTGKILELSEDSIKFIDKYGVTLEFPKKELITFIQI